MNELIQQVRDLFDTPIITLDNPVKVSQIVVLIGTLAVSLAFAGFLRWWFRRLFNRLRMRQNTINRLQALLFLIVMIIGGSLAFRAAEISTGILGKFLHYPLTNLFQAAAAGGEGPSVHNLTLARLFYAFVIVFGMFIVSKYLQWLLRREVLQAFQIADHTQFILLRFLHFTLIIIGIIISLSTVGISLTSIALIFGGLSIGIGFGLQNIASNLVSGFILIFERPIKIGDLVEIMDLDLFGRVHSINLRSTVIVALDEKEIIVPNSQLITESVHNLTHDNHFFRLRISVGVSYNSDVELVKKVLIETAHEHPEVIQEASSEQRNITTPFVRFIRFGESSLDFELLAWIPDCFQRFDIASDLHFMIWEKFKEYNIGVPYPQRDVHFDPAEGE